MVKTYASHDGCTDSNPVAERHPNHLAAQRTLMNNSILQRVFIRFLGGLIASAARVLAPSPNKISVLKLRLGEKEGELTRRTLALLRKLTKKSF